MKIYNENRIFAKSPKRANKATKAKVARKEKPRSTEEMVTSARKSLAKVKKPEPELNMWQQYRQLMETAPAEATKFWNANKEAIYALTLKNINDGANNRK